MASEQSDASWGLTPRGHHREPTRGGTEDVEGTELLNLGLAAAVARAQFRSRRSIACVSRQRPSSLFLSNVADGAPQAQSTQSLTTAASERWRGRRPKKE